MSHSHSYFLAGNDSWMDRLLSKGSPDALPNSRCLILALAIAGCMVVIVKSAMDRPLHIIGRIFERHHELARKSVHISYGLACIALGWWAPPTVVVIVLLTSLAAFVAVRRWQLIPALYEVYRQTYGELFYPLGALGAYLVADSPAQFVVAMLILALGDSGASLAGKWFYTPKLRLPFATASVAGSWMFLNICLAILITAVGLEVVDLAATHLIAIALLLTGLEAVSPYGADNLFLPVLAAWLL